MSITYRTMPDGEEYVKITTQPELAAWIHDGGWNLKDFESIAGVDWTELVGYWFAIINDRCFIRSKNND